MFLSRLAVVFAQSIETRCQVENVVGAAPTSEWSTILLPTKVHLMLEIWWYMLCVCMSRLSYNSDNMLSENELSKEGIKKENI